MKKRIITLLSVALVLVVTLAALTGCFFENLSIISGKMNEESAEALQAFNTEFVTEDANGDAQITLSNFTQLNRSAGYVGTHSQEVVYLFKVAENGFYMHSYAENSEGSYGAYEMYIEKDGEDWFLYAPNPQNKTEWKVGYIDIPGLVSQLSQRETLSDAIRKNIFNPNNYKPDGDHYAYKGPMVDVAIEGDYKMVMNVEGLFTKDSGIEIKGKVEPELTAEQKAALQQAGQSLESMGFNMPFSYSIYDVGTTKITFPNVINSDYKAKYKAAKQAQQNNGDDADA